jgi:hypothetical protein
VTWHVPEELFADYRDGRLDPVRVMAVESHVAACPQCRSTVPADPDWLASSWAGVLDAVAAPWWARLGVGEHRVRLLAAVPALRRSWLVANAAVLVFAVVAAAAAGAENPRRLLVFLAVAPVLPVLAVATAYGPGVDPGYEITSTTPAAGPRLLLRRSAVVLFVSITMVTVAAALLPGAGCSAGAWLLPALALVTATLAAATVVPLWVAAGVLGTGWLAAVGAFAVSAADPGAAWGPAAQTGYLVAAAAAAAVFLARRRSVDPGEPR